MTAQSAEDNSTHYTPDDPQQDIPEHPFTRLVDYFAREKTANQTDDNPCNYARTLLDWLIAGLSERKEATTMVMPSLLTWIIGAAVVVALSVVLRAVANDAQGLARSRAGASVPAEPANGNPSRKAA